ncbi:MAG: hypothetical protein HRU20_30720 [Pseudomonadales bacterium]|nr:hypothetical protein [Pseudomonadales bacterium]
MKIIQPMILTLATVSAMPAAATITEPAVQQVLRYLQPAFNPEPADYVFTCEDRFLACDDNSNVISIRHFIAIPEQLPIDMTVLPHLQSYSATLTAEMSQRADIIPETLISLSNLTELSIRFGASAENFTLPVIPSLASLSLSAPSAKNIILTLPGNLSSFGNLQQLSVQADTIDFSPVDNLLPLQKLHILHSTNVNNLPIDSMQNLQQFTWDIDEISAFEQYTLYLSQLDNLSPYSINFIDQGLEIIPVHLTAMAGLESLNLSKNAINAIPEYLSDMPDLSSLDLSHNRIDIIPESLLNSSVLSSLNLSHNRIDTIPVSLFNSSVLTSLDLSHNRIGTLPESVINIALQTLKLSFNILSQLPDNISSWNDMKTLDLSRNKLENLPADLAYLSQLENLDLSFNRLSTLPLELLTHPQMISLKLNGNLFDASLDKDLFLTLGGKLDVLDLSDNGFRGELPDFNPGPQGKPEINLNNNALWHSDPVILSQYETGIMGKSILDLQLLPPRGVRAIDRGDNWTIEWGFPLMFDTAGTHIKTAFADPEFGLTPSFYTSNYYRIKIERSGEEAEIVELACTRLMMFWSCPSNYEANYQSFGTDYRNLTAIYRYSGDLSAARISVTSIQGRNFGGEIMESTASVAGEVAEHEMYLDDIDYELQKIPDLKIKGGSGSFTLLIFLVSLLLLGTRQTAVTVKT